MVAGHESVGSSRSYFVSTALPTYACRRRHLAPSVQMIAVEYRIEHGLEAAASFPAATSDPTPSNGIAAFQTDAAHESFEKRTTAKLSLRPVVA